MCKSKGPLPKQFDKTSNGGASPPKMLETIQSIKHTIFIQYEMWRSALPLGKNKGLHALVQLHSPRASDGDASPPKLLKLT